MRKSCNSVLNTGALRKKNAAIKGLFTWKWGPQVGEVTRSGSPQLSRKCEQIKMIPCKQALNVYVLQTTARHE